MSACRQQSGIIPSSLPQRCTRGPEPTVPRSLQWCFSAAEVRALTGHLLAAGGLCCRSPRRKSPEVLLWRNTSQGSCCYFPDNCPHSAADQLQWPARCHLACAETVTNGKGPAEEGKEGRREEREGPAAFSLCSVFMLVSKCTWVHTPMVPWVSVSAAPL